jgi:hypothetical protein
MAGITEADMRPVYDADRETGSGNAQTVFIDSLRVISAIRYERRRLRRADYKPNPEYIRALRTAEEALRTLHVFW